MWLWLWSGHGWPEERRHRTESAILGLRMKRFFILPWTDLYDAMSAACVPTAIPATVFSIFFEVTSVPSPRAPRPFSLPVGSGG